MYGTTKVVSCFVISRKGSEKTKKDDYHQSDDNHLLIDICDLLL